MTDSDIQHALREMARQIGSLQSSVDTLTSTWQRQDADATEGRREMRCRVEVLTERVTAVASRVETMSAELIAIKPTVDLVKTARAEVSGVGRAGRVVWQVVGFFGAGGAGAWLVHLFGK